MDQYYNYWRIDKNAKPEIIEGLDIGAYHEDLTNISSTWLKEGLKSMKRFQMYPFKPKNEPSESQKIGNMVHTYLLEHDKFQQQYYVLRKEELPFPTSTMAKKENKEYVEAIKASGKMVIDYETHKQVYAMCDSVLSNQLICQYIDNGKIENSVYWSDDETGLPMRTRPDLWMPLSNGKIAVMDVKTTDSAYPNDFFNTASKFNYPLQAAIQCDGLTAATGKEVHVYMYLAMDKQYPYEHCLYRLTMEDIYAAKIQYKEVLKQILRCVETGRWPSYGRTQIEKKLLDDNQLDILDVVLPAYHYNK